jgi:F420-non-reducing hydrogenase small subunit
MKNEANETKKLQFAFYWAASCGGCEVAVLDIDEKILDVVALANIVFWPVAMDVKYKQVEEMEDGTIDVCFFNGSIRNSEQEHMAQLLRKKSKVLVAFGACAAIGGIPGLGNVTNKEEIFNLVYKDNPSTFNSRNIVPKISVVVKEGTLTLPEFYDSVSKLDEMVEVDYYLPGCPPTTEMILTAVEAIFESKLPPKGAVIGPLKSVCDECRFEKSVKKIKEIKRIYELDRFEEKCLLEQNVICMGPATRGGCDAPCLDANMPCIGCGGPTANSLDQGAKMISALASILGIEGETKMSDEEVQKLIDQVVDPIGTFYKFGLPAAILNRKVK